MTCALVYNLARPICVPGLGPSSLLWPGSRIALFCACGRTILCNCIAKMSAMKTVIATLCLIVAQMQVSTALNEDSSKSLMVQ